MTDQPDGNDAAALARKALYETMENGQLRYAELAKQTQNPMYAWHALWCRASIRNHQMLAGEAVGDLSIPSWCADYFSTLSFDLVSLADGLDIRREPDDIEITSLEEFSFGSDPSLGRPPLSPDEAMKLVTLALGFTRRGANAFGSLRAAQEQMEAFRRHEELMATGLKYTDALTRLMEESAIAEESVIRKRITSGRRLVKGDRPEDKEEDTGKA